MANANSPRLWNLCLNRSNWSKESEFQQCNREMVHHQQMPLLPTDSDAQRRIEIAQKQNEVDDNAGFLGHLQMAHTPEKRLNAALLLADATPAAYPVKSNKYREITIDLPMQFSVEETANCADFGRSTTSILDKYQNSSKTECYQRLFLESNEPK